MMQRSKLLLLLVLALMLTALALAFRYPQLEKRPMHGDEANQAVKAGILFDTGVYAYDPHEHHGPSLYYATLPLFWLSSADSFAQSTESLYRLLPVIFGSAVVILTVLFRRALGLGAVFWAGLLMAVSHAMVYYSRYYVQEMLLVFFSASTLICGYYWWRSGKLRGAILTGIFLGLIHTTKETCLIIYAAMIGAWIGAALLGWLREGSSLRPASCLRPKAIALLVFAASAVSVLLFSSFFTHARGPLDSILAFSTYFMRAEGQGSTGLHDKPWYYYVQILGYVQRSAGPRWSEGLILALAGIGLIPALLRRSAPEHTESPSPDPVFLRFLAIYSLLLLLAYSLIPYKTPWNMLIFLHPMILLAGFGAASLIRWARWVPLRILVSALLLLGVAQLAHQSKQGNYVYSADTRNPYVYAHTSTALMRLVKRVDEIAAFAPEGHAMQINIFKPDADYWPLPWYLRSFSRVGYWPKPPKMADAPFIIADPALAPYLKEALKDKYMQEYHALRPGILLHTYIRQDLWDDFIASRS